MADASHQLLAATIGRLEELRSQGVQYIPMAPGVLAALAAPRRRATPRASAPVGEGVAPSAPAAPRLPANPTVKPVAEEQPLALLEGVKERKALSREGKEAAMAELRARATACRKCDHLAKARRNVVFGVGDIHSPLMFIGEAPGMDEDAQGEPFVGAAGQLLTRIITAMGFSRSSVYIANILKCRPDTPGRTAGNRKPTPSEMAACIPFLREQIDIIQPKVMVALGATAVEGLLGKCDGITRLRGQWRVFEGIPLMLTYHPAYLLRNQALSEKRRVWEDMLQVLEKLGAPITAKQRGFFLSKSS